MTAATLTAERAVKINPDGGKDLARMRDHLSAARPGRRILAPRHQSLSRLRPRLCLLLRPRRPAHEPRRNRRGRGPARGLPRQAQKGCRVVKQAAWREEFYACYHGSQKQGAKQKAFVRVHGDLYEAHLVEYAGEYACLWPDKPDKSDF